LTFTKLFPSIFGKVNIYGLSLVVRPCPTIYYSEGGQRVTINRIKLAAPSRWRKGWIWLFLLT